MLGKIIALMNFLARHATAALVSVIVPLVLWTILDCLLFVVALVTNQDLGGPLALPAGLVFFFIFSLVETVLLLFPVVVLSEILSMVFGKLKYIAQVLLFTLLAAGMITLSIRYMPNGAVLDPLGQAIVFLLFFVSLSIYWGTAKVVELIIAIPTAFGKWLFPPLFR